MARAIECMSWEDMKQTIRPGDRVTGRFPSGLGLCRGKSFQEYSEQTGRVVIAPSRIDAIDWFVLNMGGRHGIPKCVSESNFIVAYHGGKRYRLKK